MFEAIHSSRTLPNPRTAIVSVTVRFRALTIIGESSSVSGSTSNLVVLGWLSLICWSGDLNSHQALKPPADSTAPTVSTVMPTGGATNVDTTTNVVASFSEAMDASSVTDPANFTLHKE